MNPQIINVLFNSNDEHNITTTEGGVRLVYNYNGGNDTVNSTAENANDIYKINKFTANSSLIINDTDAYDLETYEDLDQDTVVFSNDVLDDVRIFFNVNNTDEMPDFESLIFMHKDVASSLTNTWENEKQGVIKMNGINVLDAFKDEAREDLNISAWADKIKQDVVGWLTDNGYSNTDEVFNAEKKDGDIEALIAEYNKSYDIVMNA